MKKLVIVESPSKAKTINKYLGKDYIVKASKGHIIDLPKSKMAIDTENGFKANYEVTKKAALQELKKAYKESEGLILAVDLDREGEAIGWHVAQALGAIKEDGTPKKGHEVQRIVFSEITKDAIQEAMNQPRDLNMDLVNAQQARRFLDRLVGYGLSPVLWKKISFGLSAGRVQSAALRLIVEREAERDAFKADEYWSLHLFANKSFKGDISIEIFEKESDPEDKKEFEAKYAKDIRFELLKVSGKKAELVSKDQVQEILADRKSSSIQIESVDKKVTKKYPKPPFTTSTLQQAAVNVLGFTAKRTMMVAQKLYEAGHITYMRTDSLSMSKQAIDQARKVIAGQFGKEYVPAKPVVYKSKSKGAQEAHECIRPVNLAFRGDKSFSPEQVKLYEMILNRTLASQMNPAEVEQMAVIGNVDELSFKTNGSRVLFDGFLAAGLDKTTEQILPELIVGDKLAIKALQGVQHFTQPPARFSEASLVKELEKLGIGRPSTYASIISTIMSRKYVDKDGRYLFPTDTGKVVTKLLTKYFFDIVDYDFTSNMEDKLDTIAEGKLDWKKMLTEFYFPFEKDVKLRSNDIPREEFTVLGEAPEDVTCPECGSLMQIKLSRYGKFYSCSKWPDCKGMRSIDGSTAEDTEKEVETDDFKNMYQPAPKTEDGRDFLLKKGKFGKFWAHPDYPKVKDARPLELLPERLKEIYGEPPKTDKGKEYILRKGRFGEFWAHPEYPKVKDIIKIKKQEE